MAFCSPRPSCEGQELASFHGAYGTPRENPSLKLLTHNLEEPRMETWDPNGASSVRGFLNIWFGPLDRSLRRVFRQPARRWREQQCPGRRSRSGRGIDRRPCRAPAAPSVGGAARVDVHTRLVTSTRAVGLGHVLAAQRKACFNSTSAGGLIWT